MATRASEYEMRKTRLRKGGLEPERMTLREQLEADGFKPEGRSLWEVSGLQNPTKSVTS